MQVFIMKSKELPSYSAVKLDTWDGDMIAFKHKIELLSTKFGLKKIVI